MTDLAEIQRNWELYARSDPMWAALMDPGRKGGAWDPDAFFQAGEAEIATVLERLRKIGTAPDRSGRALDFGCGMGRLTQALARRFASVSGVDISPTMVELARSHNRYPEKCDYLLNETDDLRMLEDESFAFIYSSVVLQHMSPQHATGYLLEFARLLAPGGILAFQVPDRLAPGGNPVERARLATFKLRRMLGIRTRTRRALRRLGLLHRLPDAREAAPEMHCIPEDRVRECLRGGNLRCVDIQLTNSTTLSFAGGLKYLAEEPTVGFVSKQYCAVKAT